MKHKLKYLVTFERYEFIQDLNLQDIEKQLDKIESLFNNEPYEELLDCLIDLENLGININENSLIPILWKGSKLYQTQRRTLDHELVKFLQTDDYLTNGKFFGNDSIITIMSEQLQKIIKSRGIEQFRLATDSGIVRQYFISDVRKQTVIFDELIKDGWMIGFGMDLRKVKHPENKQVWIDTLFTIKNRLKEIYGYELILAGNTSEPFLILVNQNNIKSL